MILHPRQNSFSTLLTEAIAARTTLLTPLRELPDFKSRIATVALRILVTIALEVTTSLDLLKWTIKTCWCWNAEHFADSISIVAALVLNFGMVAGYRLHPKQNQPLIKRSKAIDFSVEIPEKISNITSSQAYIAWKCMHNQWLHNDIIQMHLNADETLRYLVCPISKHLPEIPV